MYTVHFYQKYRYERLILDGIVLAKFSTGGAQNLCVNTGAILMLTLYIICDISVRL